MYIDDVAIDITSMSRGGKHNRIQSLHTDRLGSTVGVFNTSGYLHESRSYDAFGTPRGSLNSDRFNAILGSTVSPRGFTQHEHLDGAQLIHMNGRVYDYHLGRFLSVDPFIQGVGNSQGVNPYSYILNNPLAGTDPSGYVAVTGLDRWSGMPDPMGYGDNCPFCVNTGDDKEGQDNGAEAGGQAGLNITITADNIGGQGDVGANQSQNTQNQTVEHGLFSQVGHTVLGFLGAVPLIGGAADAIDTVWYAAQGDMVGASLSGASTVLSAVPGADQVAAGSKIAHVLGVAKGANAFSKVAPATAKQLQKKFKHAEDFGVSGNYNNANAKKFNEEIQSHLNSSGVKEISGSYRGNPVTFHTNPKTGLTVIQNPNGKFLSGWKLNPQQLQHVLKDGKL